MAFTIELWLFILAALPVAIDSYRAVRVRRQTQLEPSWQSIEVIKGDAQPLAKTGHFLRNLRHIVSPDPYENYRAVPYKNFPASASKSELTIESSFGQRQEAMEEFGLSILGEDEDEEFDEEAPPHYAENRLFLGALAPLALVGLSIPALATLGIAGVVILPLAGLALTTGFKRLFNSPPIEHGLTPGEIALEGPAGQLLGNLLMKDRMITVYNTEFTLSILTRSTTSTNTVSSASSTGFTPTYLVYYSTVTWSSTETSVSVSTYSSPLPSTHTSSATSSKTFYSQEVSSSTDSTVSVTVSLSINPTYFTSSTTSISTSTIRPSVVYSTTATTQLATGTSSDYTTFYLTYSTVCNAFYP